MRALLAHTGMRSENIRNSSGHTSVMRAVIHGSVECVKLLVSDSRVDLETRDDKGMGLEERARWGRCLELVLTLYYRMGGHQEIAMIIQEARRGRQEVTRQETRQEARQEVRGAGGVAELRVAMQRYLNLGAAAYEVASFTFLISTKNIFLNSKIILDCKNCDIFHI